jgi:hypothetical protein
MWRKLFRQYHGIAIGPLNAKAVQWGSLLLGTCKSNAKQNWRQQWMFQHFFCKKHRFTWGKCIGMMQILSDRPKIWSYWKNTMQYTTRKLTKAWVSVLQEQIHYEKRIWQLNSKPINKISNLAFEVRVRFSLWTLPLKASVFCFWIGRQDQTSSQIIIFLQDFGIFHESCSRFRVNFFTHLFSTKEKKSCVNTTFAATTKQKSLPHVRRETGDRDQHSPVHQVAIYCTECQSGNLVVRLQRNEKSASWDTLSPTSIRFTVP